MLVLLHPSQQVLDVAQGHIIQLRTRLCVGLVAGLCQGSLGGGPKGLEAQVVIATQVYQTLMESINPIQKTVMFILNINTVLVMVITIMMILLFLPAVHLVRLWVAPIL